MDAIVDFMMGPKATVSEIHTLSRRLKVRRNWEKVFLHPDNNFIHETHSMCPPPPHTHTLCRCSTNGSKSRDSLSSLHRERMRCIG